MSQLTLSIPLTQTWILIATASGFIGQKNTTSVIEVCNADSLPVGSVAVHTVRDNDSLQFPKPFAGNWYARVRNEITEIIVTKV